MEGRDLEVDKIFRMFAQENGTMAVTNVTVALKCLGFPVKEGETMANSDMSIGEFKELIKGLDQNAAICHREELYKAFMKLDPSNTGYVKANALKELFLKSQSTLTETEVKDFFIAFPSNSNGEIAYGVLIDTLCPRANE